MRKKTFFLFIVLAIVSFSFVSSEVCCFYPSNGICSERVPSNVCTENSGIVVGSSCSSSAECSMGCCVLGLGVKYTTRRQCELDSLSGGFQVDWRPLSEDQCSNLASSGVMGACVYNYDFCSYTKKENCRGTDKIFYEGKLCSDPSLKTRCSKTDRTKCFEDGNIYFVDSCGNRDSLVQECKYSEGFICVQNTSKKAICKSLNCVDKWGNKRKNGESWCIGLDGNVLTDDVRGAEFKKTDEKLPAFNDAVGSRFFRQVCIDGEIVTEPCADYRNEVCIPMDGGAKCVANWGDACYDANVVDEVTGENKIEDCDPEWCYITRLDDCIQFQGEETIYCGQQRKDWRNLPQAQAGKNLMEVSSPLLQDLNLRMCVPKIAPGSDISSKIIGSEKSGAGICSLGDYSRNIGFKRSKRDEYYYLYPKLSTCNSTGNFAWGCGGIFSLSYSDWSEYDGWTWKCETNSNNPIASPLWKDRCGDENDDGCLGAACIKSGQKKALPINNPGVTSFLSKRLVGISDCAGDSNWVGASGSIAPLSIEEIPCKYTGGEKHRWEITCYYSFKAKPWRPPSSGNCSLCGADGLPCSEYRCKAIGKNCEYKEPRGIDTGVCVSSNDFSGPVISISQDPPNPIPPYSSVKITITTNEDSYCKFDFKSGGVNIENMKYETDSKFGKTHEFILSAPRAAIDNEDIQAYPFLTRDGKYEIFIMCEDSAGNANQKVHQLEVMKTPDEIPPSILEFVPPSNSFVEFNRTTKRIRFKLNEPAECRWDFDGGKAYGEMGLARVINEEGEEEVISQNDFACDNEINEETTAKGYWCEGELRNITTVVGNSTKFYIKCKDQPWLEGKENQYYKRNENQRAFEYSLRPSMALEIVDFSPKGEYITGSDKQNLSIQLKTANGVERGKAECKWKLKINNISSAWKFFNRTNSTTHTDVILNLVEGDYEISVQCEDAAGNLAQDKYSLVVIIDKEPPKLLRVYNDKGNLKIVLNEKATSCKFLNSLGCAFVAQNGTTMSRIKDNEFTTGLKKGQLYYIRCEDVFGNSACYPEIFVH
ncbi:MAG: hypothetical protein QXX68_00350 [Candidatus Pacearchaeota archaeon]